MVVYIEDCLIENFFVTLLLLITTRRLFKDDVSNLKLAIVSLFGSVISVLYPILQIQGILLVLFKISTGAIIVCMAFVKKNILPKCFTFMFLTGLYGGINIFVYSMAYGTLQIEDNFPTVIILIMLFATYYFCISLIKLLERKKWVANFVYNIEIENDGIIIKDEAFLDSGNMLKDGKDGAPVYIINFNIFNRLYKNIQFEDLLIKNFKNLKNPHYVKSSYASGNGNILVFSVDKLKVHYYEKTIQINNVLLGISYYGFEKTFNFNMLLNAILFIN